MRDVQERKIRRGDTVAVIVKAIGFGYASRFHIGEVLDVGKHFCEYQGPYGVAVEWQRGKVVIVKRAKR